MKNKYGVEYDFLIFSCLMLLSCIVIFVVGYIIQRNERFSAMQYLVSTVGSTAMVYDVQTGMTDEKIYLSKMINGGIMKTLINPFNTETYCDADNSFVYKKDNIYYVTLKCGGYSVRDYAVHHSSKMTIYKESSLGATPIKILSVEGE